MDTKEFAAEYIGRLKSVGIKKFPDEFLFSAETKTLSLPGKTLILGQEFFGTYDISDTSGTKVITAPNMTVAKFILYSNRELPKEIQIPVEEAAVEKSVKNYERFIDNIASGIIKDFRIKFPERKDFFETLNYIFNAINLQRY